MLPCSQDQRTPATLLDSKTFLHHQHQVDHTPAESSTQLCCHISVVCNRLGCCFGAMLHDWQENCPQACSLARFLCPYSLGGTASIFRAFYTWSPRLELRTVQHWNACLKWQVLWRFWMDPETQSSHDIQDHSKSLPQALHRSCTNTQLPPVLPRDAALQRSFQWMLPS